MTKHLFPPSFLCRAKCPPYRGLTQGPCPSFISRSPLCVVDFWQNRNGCGNLYCRHTSRYSSCPSGLQAQMTCPAQEWLYSCRDKLQRCSSKQVGGRHTNLCSTGNMQRARTSEGAVCRWLNLNSQGLGQANRSWEAHFRDPSCIQKQSQLQKLQTAKLVMPNKPISAFGQTGVQLQ